MLTQRTRVPAFVLSFGLAIALAGAACNSNGGGGAPSQAAGNTPAAGNTQAAGASQGGGGNAATIANFAFSPASITVKAGTSVTWTNNDSTTHTVTADDGSFDSGDVATGAGFTQMFATAGTFTYHCKIHSSMHGTVVVTP